MSEREKDSVFEELIVENVPEPPEDIVQGVTPWKTAMTRALAGIALNTLKLNFLMLDYILPAVGLVLLVLGFRALRRENGGFKLCYILSVIRCTAFFCGLVLSSSVLYNDYMANADTALASVLSFALSLVMLLGLRRGFIATKSKVGLPPKAGAVWALILWYGLCFGLIMLGGGTISALIILVSYIFIIRALMKISRDIAQAGYAIEAAPVRISDGALAGLIAGAALIGIVIGYVFFSRYPMQWAEKADLSPAAVEVRAELIELGFPEDVIDDLSEEDILACEGAARVYVESYDYTTPTYEERPLLATGVAVELPGERESWRLFHHFDWYGEKLPIGTACLDIRSADDRIEGWAQRGVFSGQVVCSRNGTELISPYNYLGTHIYTHESFFFSTYETRNDCFASFSFPREAQNCRFYVAYEIEETIDGYVIYSMANFTYQAGISYPSVSAMASRTGGQQTLTANSPFKLLQPGINFFPEELGTEPLE